MKRIIVILCCAAIITSAFLSFRRTESGIFGTIEPADAARKVWALSGADSVSVLPISGKFSLAVKPGTWMLYVEGLSPYQNAVRDNVLVQDGQMTDVGVIKLEKP